MLNITLLNLKIMVELANINIAMTYFKILGNWVYNYGVYGLLILVAAGFFVFTSSFNYLSQDQIFIKWLSPDETANYTVAKLYAETGNLTIFEKYNLLAKDIIHPRSFRSDWGLIKPVSFLGLPLLYGHLAVWLGVEILPYLTPLFGALGLIFFYLLIRKIFDASTALVATLLASVFPVYIYYAARSMFHNVLFLFALIAGLYFLTICLPVKSSDKSYLKHNLLSFLATVLAGLMIGLALVTRTSELLWLGPLLLGLWLFNIKRFGFIRPWLFLYGGFMVFLPIFYWNNILYGSFFSSGYPELNSSLASLTQDSSTLAHEILGGKLLALKATIFKIGQTIFHFGFSLKQSYKMFQSYFYQMFPWLFWSASLGILTFLSLEKEYKKRRWLFLIGWLGLSLVLIIYYGSWVFFDNPDPKSFTIGNSYTRYWLPFYFGAIALASLFLVKITNLLKYPVAVWGVRLIAIAIVATLSIQYIWLEPAEGLKVSIQKQIEAKVEWSKVLALTEPNAVIITRYHDKLFFPERKVIVGLFNDKNMIKEYANLVKKIPVYYYNFSYKPDDVVYLNNGLLKEFNLNLNLVEIVTDRFSLYRLIEVKSEIETE